MRLNDKVAIVTGSAQGIGREYAARLRREGAKVVLADVLDAAPAAEELRGEDGGALALHVDVSSEEAATEMARRAVEQFGRIDILVNNAAIFGEVQRNPFDRISVGEWDQVMAVNVKGLFLCSRAVVPQMKSQGSGRIINISSSTVLQGTPMFLHYVTSKGAVVAFTRALARELGEYGITVNAIAPGHTMSDAVKRRGPNADVRSVAARSIKRSQVPQDLAGTVVFLSSEDSAFITGQLIVVDGGGDFH